MGKTQMYQFVATMPAVYERLYTPSEAAEHAAIVARREGRPVHAEVWTSAKGPQLCVVAQDRPGLLAVVTDALLAQGMAVQSARAFCRQVGRDRLEAVDFLELHAVGGREDVAVQLEGEALPAFLKALTDLISDETALGSAPSPASTSATTRVYFERQSPADGHYLLVVDAPDSDGLLHSITSTLHAKGLHIVACEIRTLGGRALDRFEIEPSSQRTLGDAELCDIQLAVLDSLPSRR
jgi:[protein-PII] uridylyltransferase